MKTVLDHTKSEYVVEAYDEGWFNVSDHRKRGPALASRRRFLKRNTDFTPRSVRVVVVDVHTLVRRIA